MTPGARVAAAIEILDQIDAGTPAEQALTRWARASRFAGSKDRAAVRDHVFDALRHWRSDAARGGGTSGRARMIGRIRAVNGPLSSLYSGQGHAPAPLSEVELSAGQDPSPGAEAYDLPDWLVPHFERSLGTDWPATAQALQHRAPVSVRVNLRRGSVNDATAKLVADGIQVQPNSRAGTALTLTKGARRLRQSQAYLSGWVELQDAASQAAVAQIQGQGKILDYCAGGGGKALALAAQGWTVTAHDAEPARMTDLPTRAARGGHDIDVVHSVKGTFDAVLCDAPCSGAGTWRRTPEAKWRLTPERLQSLVALQADILEQAHRYVAARGDLYYATCSVLDVENAIQIEQFLERHPDWVCVAYWSWPVDDEGDGFFMAHLRRRTES